MRQKNEGPRRRTGGSYLAVSGLTFKNPMLVMRVAQHIRPKGREGEACYAPQEMRQGGM